MLNQENKRHTMYPMNYHIAGHPHAKKRKGSTEAIPASVFRRFVHRQCTKSMEGWTGNDCPGRKSVYYSGHTLYCQKYKSHSESCPGVCKRNSGNSPPL